MNNVHEKPDLLYRLRLVFLSLIWKIDVDLKQLDMPVIQIYTKVKIHKTSDVCAASTPLE